MVAKTKKVQMPDDDQLSLILANLAVIQEEQQKTTARLEVVEQDRIAKVKPMMVKGNRTKITGWITAILPIVGIFGINVDPEAVVKLVQDLEGTLMAAFAALGGLIHYFRSLADEEN